MYGLDKFYAQLSYVLKSFIIRALWTFIEDVSAYIYVEKPTKISRAGQNYESIRTLSYNFISSSDPSGSAHQRIYSSLRETVQLSLCCHARIQRGSRGSGPPGKSQC